MGKRINPAAIGGFIVGAVALIIVGVLVLSRGQFLSDKRPFVLFFDGSVKGLNIGAPVDFQGVQVGSVTAIQLQYLVKDHEFRTPVFIEIEADRIKRVGVRDAAVDAAVSERRLFKSLIERGLLARLETQRLVTGQLFIQLGLHPGTPVRLVGTESKVPELPTIPTTLQQASQAAQDLLEKIKDTQQLVRQFDSRIGRMMDGVTDTAKVAQATMTHAQARWSTINSPWPSRS